MTNTARRLILALFALLPVCGFASGLTPATFIQSDVEAREATLAGLQERLNILRAGGTPQDEMAAMERSQARVTEVFARYGTTSAAHGAYAASQGRAITNWLQANPDWPSRYTDLSARMQQLSAEFDRIRGR